jgi:hypothetical protein
MPAMIVTNVADDREAKFEMRVDVGNGLCLKAVCSNCDAEECKDVKCFVGIVNVEAENCDDNDTE